MESSLSIVATILILIPVLLAAYAYVGYPILLSVLSGKWKAKRYERADTDWPMISITVPVYNESGQIRDTIASLLALDYPADRRQIVFVSDASDDGTDEIVAEYADQGIELLRIEGRVGKTEVENQARTELRGEIIINTDASIRIQPGAIKPLVAALDDPRVGVASGRDVSTSAVEGDTNSGEQRYVGYEMWVRDLETQAGGIVGASGCLYAIRSHLHRKYIPPHLSRDFSSALNARLAGYRAVSVPDALCVVPRGVSLRREYRRKVRTITRGLGTLLHNRQLLNPFQYGRFAWMLFSHKVCRWLVPWAGIMALLGLMLLGLAHPLGLWVVGATALLAALAVIGWAWPESRSVPRLFATPAFVASGNLAALVAWIRVFRGQMNPVWEPTRRETAGAGAVR